MGAELGGDAVEIVIGRLIAVQLTGQIVLGVVQLPYPGAFNDLNGIGENHGPFFAGGLFNETLFQLELAFGHLVLRLVTGPAEFYTFSERLGLIVHKVNGAFAGTQNVLGGVGGIAAGKEHGVEILARNIVGLYQGIGTQSGRAVFTQGGDYHSGHGKKQGGLIKIIYHAKIFKTGHKHDSFNLSIPAEVRLRRYIRRSSAFLHRFFH